MPIRNAKELFVSLLSRAQQGTERTINLLRELSAVAQNQEIEEALEARAFVAEKTLATLDEVFAIIDERPVTLTGRLHDVFAEEFHKQLAEIQSPDARRIFVLATANQLVHLRIGEYVALIAAADITGNYGVGVLLESCLADTLASVDRTCRMIRNIIETKVSARAAS